MTLPTVALATVALALTLAARRAGVAARLAAPAASADAAGWRLPPLLRAALLQRLSQAAIALSPEDAALVWAAAGVLTGGLGFALAGVTGGAAGLAAGLALPLAGLAHASRRRDERVAASLPDLLEALARELRGGGTLASGLERLAARRDGAGIVSERLVHRLRFGVGLGEAVTAWSREPRRAGAGAVLVTAGALRLADDHGGRAATPLEGLAAALRDRAAVAAEARSLSAQGRLSAAVVGALPLVTLLGSPALGGGGLDVLLHTGAGRVALVGGLALEALAVVWMRRIVQVSL